jgi:hypothetical protein
LTFASETHLYIDVAQDLGIPDTRCIFLPIAKYMPWIKKRNKKRKKQTKRKVTFIST